MSTRDELRDQMEETIWDASMGLPDFSFGEKDLEAIVERLLPLADAYVAEKLAEPTSRLEALREYATNGHWQGLLTSRSVLEILDGEESL